VKEALLVLAAGAGLALLLVLTLAAFGQDVGTSLRLLADGAFGDKYGIGRTAVRACPLILCALGLTVAWRAGMYNIGGEGQYLTGAVAGGFIYQVVSGVGPVVFHVVGLLGAAAAGAGLAWFAGWLEVKRGVQVVISTILMNFIVLKLVEWLVRGPLQEPNGLLPTSERLSREMMLARPDPQTDFHIGIWVVPIAILATWFWLYRTRAGFLNRAVGENQHAVRAAGQKPAHLRLRAMMISGALCGLAGGIDYMGWAGQISDGFSQEWGFIAIPVALLGALNPFGVAAAGVYFAALFAGSKELERFSQLDSSVVLVVQAAAVLGIVWAASWMKNRQQGGSE
jgi:simple sugar transport system permease protein